jgi:kynurenine formamidase
MSMSRRFFAHCLACAGLAAGFSATRASAQGAAQAPWSPPAAADRCPSKWGGADVRGSMNLQTAEQVQKASRLIRSGRVVELGHTLEPAMPFFGTRRFDVHLKQMFMNPQASRRGSNEELVVTELGQVGTQLDAFPHQTIGDETYNCTKVSEISSRGGFTKMGVDGIGQVFTRGVLIDVAKQKGVRTLGDDYEITVDDLQQAMSRQNVRIERGDVVLIRTGWDALWGTENARYVRSCPGIGVAAAEWLIRQDPIILGSDNWPVEVAPSKTMPHASLPVHQIALAVNGVHLLENMRLNDLSETGQGEFAFIMQPLKMKGGSGSTVAPTAVL